MLEWMHDDRVTLNLLSNFATKTEEDAKSFIKTSWSDNNNVHLAIASNEDIYMGTVSLKHIAEGCAEFAITVRFESMGRGYSWFGMRSILEMAFKDYGLDSVYWCVSKDNLRAIHFYEKHNFKEATDIPQRIIERYDSVDNLKWYLVKKTDVFDVPESVCGCNIIHIKTISTPGAGSLSFFEATHDIPFDIKRIYFIANVPEGVSRGFHAHKDLKQLLFCPYGSIQIVLENKCGKAEYVLSDPSVGIVIDKCTWREMIWLKKDSILCVAASDYYKTDDYIRDYKLFRQYIGG